MSVNAEPLYSIESGSGRLLYTAHNLEGILLAAAAIHIDFPGEDFVVKKAGEYDPNATLLAQDGMVA